MSTKDITDKQVVAAVAQYKREYGKWPYELLAESTGECEKVCYRAMERAAKHGLLEYGTSLRTAWLTDKGRQLLGEEHELLEEGVPVLSADIERHNAWVDELKADVAFEPLREFLDRLKE